MAADEVKAALASQGQSSAPPFDFNKSTTVAGIEGTNAQTTSLTLQKGDYVFLCFLSDRGGGPPHFTLGMLEKATVT